MFGGFYTFYKVYHYLLIYWLFEFVSRLPEAATRGVLLKKGVLKRIANLTGKHLFWSFFFNKAAGLRPTTLLKKRLQHRYFPMKVAKFLRTPILKNICQWLLLDYVWFLLLFNILIQLFRIYLPLLNVTWKRGHT